MAAKLRVTQKENQINGFIGGYAVVDRQQHHRISCKIDGQTFLGNYWVAGKILVVSTSKGGASTQLAPHQPEALAEHLLRKLAVDGKA